MDSSRLVEFVCNLPGPVQELVEYLEDNSLGTSCKPRVFVEVQPDWTRVGDNFIGDPHGKHIKGHQGIYVIPEQSEWLFPERGLDWNTYEGVDTMPIGVLLLFEVYDTHIPYRTGLFGRDGTGRPIGTIGGRFHFDFKIKRWASISHLTGNGVVKYTSTCVGCGQAFENTRMIYEQEDKNAACAGCTATMEP